MLRLYDYGPSGNCYKVRLLLPQLGIEYQRVAVDLLTGQARSEAFAEINPLQKVPVLEWPDGRRLTESNAILFYLADGTEMLSNDRWERARVLEWQSFEQFSLVPYVGSIRFWNLSGALDDNAHLLEQYSKRGYRALRIIDDYLSGCEYFVGDRYGIADVTMYAYTHIAPEGGFDLAPLENIQRWLERVESQPKYVSITD